MINKNVNNYIKKNWDRGTKRSRYENMESHFARKGGAYKSLLSFTEAGVRLRSQHINRAVPHGIGNNRSRQGVKIHKHPVTGNRYGIYSRTGGIVTHGVHNKDKPRRDE
jgi:hypothetical protein